MENRKKANGKLIKSYFRIFVHHTQVQSFISRKFLLPFFYHQGCQELRIDWRIAYAVHNKWNTANMIQMSVSDDHCANFIFSFFQVFEIRQCEVCAHSLFFINKMESYVEHNDV